MLLLLVASLLSVVLLAVGLYLRLKWTNNNWRRRGVKQSNPIVIFGDVKDIFFMIKSDHRVYHELYTSVSEDEPALGYYEMRRPALLIRHFTLAKKILVDEFPNFHRNDWYHEPTDLILNNHPSFARNLEKWNYLRNIGVHLQATGKLSKIVPHLITCCNHMIEHLSENAERMYNADDVSLSYSTDSSVRCIYGLHSNSFQNINCIYKKINAKLFNIRCDRPSTKLLAYFFPKIGEFFKVTLTPKLFTDFYLNTVRDSIKYRAKYECEIEMFDFLQLLMELNEKYEHLNFNLEEMTAHTLTLLSECYATTSVALTHALDLLSMYVEVQNELRQEINDRIHSKDDVSFEILEDLPYLKAFVAEMFRVRPPVPVVHKICTKDCILEESGRKYPFKVGDRVTIPILSIQTDERYFPDANMFEPARFVDTSVERMNGYLPFGLGGRTCLGKKFALLQVKTFIVALLKNFRIIRNRMDDKTEFDETQLYYLKIKGNISIKFILLENENEYDEERLV